MKMYAAQSENIIIMNVGIRVENQIIEVLVKMVICEIVARSILNAIKHVNFMNIQILRMAYAKNISLANNSLVIQR